MGNEERGTYPQSILNQMLEGVQIVDSTYRYLFVNDAAVTQNKMSREELMGRTQLETYPNFEKTEVFATIRNCLEKHVEQHIETEFIFPDGSKGWYEIRVEPIPEGALILSLDITERKHTGQQLLLSELRYRKLFETAKDGILLIDPATEKIIDANPYLLELIRYSKEEIMGKELWEIGAMQDAKYAKAMFEELQMKGYVRYEDLPLKSKDGQEREVEFVSNRYPINGTEMIQCNIRDITERKAAEKKAATYLEGLEKLNKMMTGREIKMTELKKEIDELKGKLDPKENVS